jgi:peptide deformylase
MVNPIIVKRSTEQYTTEEVCMSLEGTQEVVRFKNISVMFTNQYNKIQTIMCGVQLSQTVQHEVDHCNGKLI